MIKRAWICFVVLMLCGCGSANNELEQALAFRAAILNAPGCTFQISATADFSDMTYSFKMNCEADQNGNIKFAVKEPEYIAGITGSIQYDGGKLCFDDVAFAFPLQNEGYLTPISGPWIMLRAIRSGYIRYCGREEGLLRITVDDSFEEDALMLDVWFDRGNIPLQADIYENNRRILTVIIKNYVLL